MGHRRYYIINTIIHSLHFISPLHPPRLPCNHPSACLVIQAKKGSETWPEFTTRKLSVPLLCLMWHAPARLNQWPNGSKTWTPKCSCPTEALYRAFFWPIRYHSINPPRVRFAICFIFFLLPSSFFFLLSFLPSFPLPLSLTFNLSSFLFFFFSIAVNFFFFPVCCCCCFRVSALVPLT